MTIRNVKLSLLVNCLSWALLIKAIIVGEGVYIVVYSVGVSFFLHSLVC